MELKPKIELTGCGLVRWTPVFIGHAVEALQAMASELPSFAYQAFKLPNHQFPVHLAVKRDCIRTIVRLSEVKLTTVFRPVTSGEGSPYVYPVWKESESRDYRATMIWKPAAVPLYLVSVFNPPPDIGLPPENMDSSYLLAALADKTYRLPMANLFNEAKICFDNQREWHGPVTGIPISERVQPIIDKLNNSQWNHDRLVDCHSPEQTQALFRFTLEGKTIECRNWIEQCSVVSTQFYGDIPFFKLISRNL